ncbi:MAG: TVP38/TMEM64 family protein [Spirochaetes bacterium]|nr:TVP38/TMEM64 family protein [Spirochaetota bacterium]
MGKKPTGRKAEKQKGKNIISIIAFPLLFVLIFLFVFIFHRQLWEIFSSPDKLKRWVISGGILSPLLFIGLQALQVIVFIIPGEVPQIAGGYLFGIPDGILLSVVGIAIGSTLSFYLSRILGIPFVRSIFKPRQVEKMEKLIVSPRSKLAFFLLFLIPGIPKDILCYIAGLSPMKILIFLLISTTGRLPGIIGSVMMGDAAAGKQWVFAGIIFTIAVVLFFIGFLFREKLELWIASLSQNTAAKQPAKSKDTEKCGPNQNISGQKSEKGKDYQDQV